LYHSFVVGSVPIYWGAPNVEKFLPAPNAAIRVDDFASGRELALHLRFLMDNPAEYDAMLEWKRTGNVAQSFRDLELTSPRSAPCRLCEAVAKRQEQLQQQ
jgi:alpha-1,4-fucosyltransferase